VISRRMVLGGLLASGAWPALAEVMESSPRPVPRGGQPAAMPVPEGDVEALIAAAKLGGEVAFVVADGATGVVLASRKPDYLMPPASVAKAVTPLCAGSAGGGAPLCDAGSGHGADLGRGSAG
jgi:serine-type D-Ala-D-Ala carboxypeptidase/endopeptidase (penicillin-binding protein 4)